MTIPNETCIACDLPIANWPENDASGCQCKPTPLGEHRDAFIWRVRDRIDATPRRVKKCKACGQEIYKAWCEEADSQLGKVPDKAEPKRKTRKQSGGQAELFT